MTEMEIILKKPCPIPGSHPLLLVL